MWFPHRIAGTYLHNSKYGAPQIYQWDPQFNHKCIEYWGVGVCVCVCVVVGGGGGGGGGGGVH